MHEMNRTRRSCWRRMFRSHKRSEWAQQNAMFTITLLVAHKVLGLRTRQETQERTEYSTEGHDITE
jgi:hypothetical protein